MIWNDYSPDRLPSPSARATSRGSISDSHLLFAQKLLVQVEGVIVTGVQHGVVAKLGFKSKHLKSGQTIVRVDPRYYRPAGRDAPAHRSGYRPYGRRE